MRGFRSIGAGICPKGARSVSAPFLLSFYPLPAANRQTGANKPGRGRLCLSRRFPRDNRGEGGIDFFRAVLPRNSR